MKFIVPKSIINLLDIEDVNEKFNDRLNLKQMVEKDKNNPDAMRNFVFQLGVPSDKYNGFLKHLPIELNARLLNKKKDKNYKSEKFGKSHPFETKEI
jgi:hypothetical protein